MKNKLIVIFLLLITSTLPAGENEKQVKILNLDFFKASKEYFVIPKNKEKKVLEIIGKSKLSAYVIFQSGCSSFNSIEEFELCFQEKLSALDEKEITKIMEGMTTIQKKIAKKFEEEGIKERR